MRYPSLFRLPRALPPSHRVRFFTTSSPLRRAFQEGDVVLVGDKQGNNDGKLVKLDAKSSISTHRGVVEHKRIIGREAREIVYSHTGVEFRVHEPTLAEYVRLTPRLVTPIYSSDANLIVSLLDIHADTPSNTPNPGPPLEILEAGTGHGALTLHLSRAIHAANPPRPQQIPNLETEPEAVDNSKARALGWGDESDDVSDDVTLGESVSDLQESALESWKCDRRAVIHTVDVSTKYSKHAEKIVSGFRHGLYAGNVNFHVGDVSEWIAAQRKSRKTETPFLGHVFLDLPNAEDHLANVAPALHVNGLLAVFNPSITQIAECVEKIRAEKMPYVLSRVVELGAGTIREWNVRAVRPRATLNLNKETSSSSSASDDQGSSSEAEQAARDTELAEQVAKQAQEEKWAMICRPKVGQIVVGGGFLGLWRRMYKSPSPQP